MTTLSEAEAQLFGRDDWWDKTGAFRLLHDINPLRLRWLQTVAGNLNDKRLLDVGCGGGIFAESAAAAGAQVVGVDTSAGAIACAKQHADGQQLAVHYRCQDGIANEHPEQYDIVSCFEMLEHTDNPNAIVADMATLLKPGGVAVFSTINRTLRAWALMSVGLEMVLKILPPNTHDYAHFIQPAELAAMCKRTGLSVCAVTGMRYSFFGKTYLLDEQDTAVNYFLAARRKAH